MRLKADGKSFSLCYPDWAKDVASLIVSDTTEATVGIFGRWGSGKSSAIEAIISVMPEVSTSKEKYVECFDINCLDLQQKILLEKIDTRIRALIGRKKNGPVLSANRAKTISQYMGSAVARGAQLFSSHKGIDAETAKQISKVTEGVTSAGLEAALQPLTEPGAPLKGLQTVVDQAHIVWFLDDLDRCYPDQAINFIAQAAEIFNSPLDEQIKSSLVIACDPEVLARHAAAVYGISLSEGLEAITKYIHVPISVPVMSTKKHRDTFAPYIPDKYRSIPGINSSIEALIGIVPARELLSALPQAFMWYDRAIKIAPKKTWFKLENGQNLDLLKLFLGWSLISINLPVIIRYLIKDPESVSTFGHLLKISPLQTQGGEDRIVANFGDLAVETVRLRPDLCCAVTKLAMNPDSPLGRFSLRIVGGSYDPDLG